MAVRSLLLGLFLVTAMPALAIADDGAEQTVTITETVHVAPSDGADTRLLVATAGCSGTSPPIYLCTTGTYQTSFSLSFSITATNYHGVLENRIEYDLGLSSFGVRCDIAGATAECDFFGSPPRPGTTVLHDCRSLDADSGLPGGEGSWSCGFST